MMKIIYACKIERRYQYRMAVQYRVDGTTRAYWLALGGLQRKPTTKSAAAEVDASWGKAQTM